MEEMKGRGANSWPLTPLGFLDRAATAYTDFPSLVYKSTTYTWSETRRRCLQVASSIKSLGIGRRQVVSVVAPNVPAMYELHFAVPMASAVLNTINTRLDARTLSILLRHSESKLIFVDYQSRPLVLESLSLFPPNSGRRPLLVLITDDDDSPSPTLDFLCTYEDMVGRGDPEFEWIRPESEREPMILNYTSGTTSSPKGVVHCHRGIFVVVLDSLVDWSVPKHPVYLWTLPMFHANGWCFPWGMAVVGGTNICLRKFDARVIHDNIRLHRVTHMCGAPVVLNMLSAWPAAHPLDNPVRVITAGAPPPASLLSRAESLGFLVTHAYGMTETAGIVLSCAWKQEWDRLPAAERARLKTRQGVRTAGTTEVEVLDPVSRLRVKREGSSIGEIAVRGGCVMLGYLKDPEATEKCMTEDGWLFTGDVAVMHPDGYIEIKDRSKDVIISGGENLSSVEVETVLYTHPAVNEAAVVGRPDDYWGETPCAFVSLKPAAGGKGKQKEEATEKDIMEYCRRMMPHYMAPKTVVIMEELPKNATGKIEKAALRQTAKRMGPSSAMTTSRM